ncbi:MAG: phasin family protein [Allosphingosinicella sp.]
MADQNTETQAHKADAPAAAKADTAPAPVAAKPAATIAKAAPAAAAKAAPAPRARKAARKAAAKPAKPARAPRKSPAQKAAPRKAAVTRSLNKIERNMNEGTKTMKNEANKVADRFQAVFGDVNERARTQIERNTRIAEELTELGRGNVEALVASTKVAAKGVETLGQEVAENARKSFEEASAALRGFAEIKSPTDFFRLQTEFARGQFDSFVAESAKVSEALIKLAGDVAEPLASRYTVAAEKVKAAVAI